MTDGCALQPKVKDYYGLWNAIDAPRWTGEPLLPQHLSPQQYKVAMGELKAIPEFFYTKTQLPVITPQLVETFLRTIPADLVIIVLDESHLEVFSGKELDSHDGKDEPEDETDE